MNKEYHNYLLSPEWAKIKIDLYESRGRKCEKCDSKTKLQVHHKTYKNIFKEEPKDLEILCDVCHRKEHGIGKNKKKKARKSKVQKVKLKRQRRQKRKLIDWRTDTRTARRQIKQSAKRRGFLK